MTYGFVYSLSSDVANQFLELIYALILKDKDLPRDSDDRGRKKGLKCQPFKTLMTGELVIDLLAIVFTLSANVERLMKFSSRRVELYAHL